MLDVTATGAATERSLSLWRVEDGETLADVRNLVNDLASADVPAVGSGRARGRASRRHRQPVRRIGPPDRRLDLEPGEYILAAIAIDDEGESAEGTAEQLRITVEWHAQTRRCRAGRTCW